MLLKDQNIADDHSLSNEEAIVKLKTAIKEELEKNKFQNDSEQNIPEWVKDAFHHKSSHSTFIWTSAAILCFDIFLLTIYQIYEDQNFRLKSVAVQIFFLIVFLVGNVCMMLLDSFLCHSEMKSKIKALLKLLEGNRNVEPKGDQFLNLHAPQSPCISLQWTYRSGQLLNLPCSLLVEGDIILMRPGHPAPGYCRSLYQSANGVQQHLKRGQIFTTIDEEFSEEFNSPRLRKPAESLEFVMLETPFIYGLRFALKNSLGKPVTLFNKEYQAVVFFYFEKILIPIVLVVTMCIGVVRCIYFESEHDEWAEHLLLRPVCALLPLVPISFPLCWIILNAFGNSYLLAIVNSKQCLKPLDPFDEMEETEVPSAIENCVKWTDLKSLICCLLFGTGGYLWRSANLLQVLGSITALCCVDKKGILSWPNPTAEKVFFLKSPKSKSNSEDSTQMCENADQESSEELQPLNEQVLEIKRFTKMNKRLDVKDHIYHPGSQVEVLDLTHNLHSPFGIQFDDPNWKLFLGNLKPLGLGILLNTCNPNMQEHYTKFSDHIACESLYNDAAVPVVNKRCLCVLAQQIGFSDSVVDFYELEQQLGIFRHVHPEVIQKGKLAKSLNFPRLKMPFPNMSCVIVKDLHRGSNQLFSQGTADLVLDACYEYWDGNDIRVLTESDRKRILDFYHRSSLTAHCMGYAYSPLSNAMRSKDFSNWFFELPAEGYHLFSVLEASSSPRSWDPSSNEGVGSSNQQQHSMNRYLSNDSLILPDQEKKLEGVNNCLQQLGNEIFIGMVTMQYQACPDFVRLIEQLDKACIRFVHFSKENELRSRVFSEKMGLESGWNCHISLLSDDKCEKNGPNSLVSPLKFSRHYAFPPSTEETCASDSRNEIPIRHASAPSMINLEPNKVKSEELSTHSKSEDSTSLYNISSSKTHLGTESLFQDISLEEQSYRKSSLQDIMMCEEGGSSHVTESTDQSAPVTFDMSNRAKLPKGTENIRPHIENVDNVPLQVSLFTDCTAEATREMICIMQEYGEVVCCLGSSANTENIPIFLQADASIAIQPLLPHLCVQQSMNGTREQNAFHHISSALNSLPCGIIFHREDPISLYHLITEARHFMCSARNSLEFMLCCLLSIALIQVLAVLFFLPLALPLSHMLWLICLEVPLLSLSLMGHPLDTQVMMLATGKNVKVANKQAILFFLVCYCAKFCPSLMIAIVMFTCVMSTACKIYLESDALVCWVTLDIVKPEKKISAESWFAVLTVSQNVLSFFLVVCFVFISISFIHRSHLLWKCNPFQNKYWIMTAIIVIVLHLMFSVIDITLHVDMKFKPTTILSHIPYYVWLLCSIWPFLVLPINELVKRNEIRINVRQQKRARLEFCTKLGMNSPF